MNDVLLSFVALSRLQHVLEQQKTERMGKERNAEVDLAHYSSFASAIYYGSLGFTLRLDGTGWLARSIGIDYEDIVETNFRARVCQPVSLFCSYHILDPLSWLM